MKRRDFLQLLGLAGAAAALPAPFQTLAQGPLDEELPLKLSLSGHEIHSAVFSIPEVIDYTGFDDDVKSVYPFGPPEIRLEFHCLPPKVLFEPGTLVDLEVNYLKDIFWKAKVYVKSFNCSYGQEEDIFSVDLVQIGERKDGQI